MNEDTKRGRNKFCFPCVGLICIHVLRKSDIPVARVATCKGWGPLSHDRRLCPSLPASSVWCVSPSSISSCPMPEECLQYHKSWWPSPDWCLQTRKYFTFNIYSTRRFIRCADNMRNVCLSAECIFDTVKLTAVQDFEERNIEKQHPLTPQIYFSKRQPIKITDKTSVKKLPTPS